MNSNRLGLTAFSFAPALCLLACGGCSGVRSNSTVLPAQPKPDSPANARKDAAVNAEANRTLENLAKAVRVWSSKSSAPTVQAAKTSVPPRVFVDIALLARHHPAWRLADSLEQSRTSNSQTPIRIAAPEVADRLSARALDFTSRVRFASSSFSSSKSSGDLSPQTLPDLPKFANGARAATVQAVALPDAFDVARRRQNNAFVAFLNDAALRQKDARFDAAETLRAALDARLDAERRTSLDALSPAALSDPVALELTNLKLSLLTASPAASVDLEKRIAVLEARWQARLRQQEIEREAELRELRRTRPAQLEREGNARIASFLKDAQRDDSALRASLRATHQTLVAEDFAAQNGVLGIALPAVAPSQIRRATANSPFFLSAKSSNAFETSMRNATSGRAQSVALPASAEIISGADINVPPLVISSFSPQVRALRLQAWNESRLWAQAAARRNGWTLTNRVPTSRTPQTGTNKEVPVRDETRFVMRSLNM